MKLLVDCDEVFDVLTRGRFPSGHESDPAVEHHLRCCHDCRQLAEALRPAVEMFHECMSAAEATELPEYHGPDFHGDVAPLPQSFLRRLPRSIDEVQLPPENMPRHDHVVAQRWTMLLQGFVATALTAAIVMLVVSFGSSLRGLKPEATIPTHPPVATANSYPEAARQLLSLKLPAACWLDQHFPRVNDHLPVAQQLALALEKEEIVCCTRCHTAAKTPLDKTHSPKLTQVATLQQSCLICHKG